MTDVIRRAILGAPFAALAISAVPAAGAVNADHPWWQTKRRYERLRAIDERFDREVWDPTWRAFEQAKDEVPHFTTGPLDGYTGRTAPLSTANAHDVAAARGWLRGLHIWPADAEIYHAACTELVKAADERAAEIRRLEISTGYDAAADTAERLGDRVYDLRRELLNSPAPDHAALAWKIEWLLDTVDGSVASWNPEAVAPTLADVRRLLGGAEA